VLPWENITWVELVGIDALFKKIFSCKLRKPNECMEVDGAKGQ
jgi:hypothetical protein